MMRLAPRNVSDAVFSQGGIGAFAGSKGHAGMTTTQFNSTVQLNATIQSARSPLLLDMIQYITIYIYIYIYIYMKNI